MKNVTLIGSTGLVGKEILKQLKLQNISVNTPTRDQKMHVINSKHENIIFCAGENRCEIETLDNLVEVNAAYLSQIIKMQNFEHLTYFSSTRIYGESHSTSEDENLVFSFNDPRALFNSSKILGESLCHFSKKPIAIVRPSNIYGLTTKSKLFLPSITRNAVESGIINMYVSKDYSKDYINVTDVAYTSIKLAERKFEGTVNIASGRNICAEEIANILEKETHCKTIWHPTISEEKFHPIDTQKLFSLFPDFKPTSLQQSLKSLIDDFKITLR